MSTEDPSGLFPVVTRGREVGWASFGAPCACPHHDPPCPKYVHRGMGDVGDNCRDCRRCAAEHREGSPTCTT